MKMGARPLELMPVDLSPAGVARSLLWPSAAMQHLRKRTYVREDLCARGSVGPRGSQRQNSRALLEQVWLCGFVALSNHVHRRTARKWLPTAHISGEPSGSRS